MINMINRWLRKIGVEVHGTGYLQSLAKGDFKKNAFMVQKELMNGKGVHTIFDIGANRGNTVMEYLEHFPRASVYAFEPFPGSYNSLAERFEHHKAVRCEMLAISDSEGTQSLYVNRNVDTNSLLKPQATGLSSDEQVENKSVLDIRTTTLDLYCSRNGIENIDILKMDIQGGELKALMGARQLLSGNKIGLIYLEVFFIEQYELQPLFHDLAVYLHSFGYYVQDIYEPAYGRGNLAWADTIFRKKTL